MMPSVATISYGEPELAEEYFLPGSTISSSELILVSIRLTTKRTDLFWGWDNIFRDFTSLYSSQKPDGAPINRKPRREMNR